MRIYLMYYEYVRKYVMSAQMFEVSLLEMGTVFWIERGVWSMVH